jgi:hypothetical protein
MGQVAAMALERDLERGELVRAVGGNGTTARRLRRSPRGRRRNRRVRRIEGLELARDFIEPDLPVALVYRNETARDVLELAHVQRPVVEAKPLDERRLEAR